MVPAYLLINVGQSSGADRKSDGVTVTSSMPWHIGWVRNPTMPMSWNNGNQETITSPGLMLALSHIDSMFAHRFRWVINTALGVEVEPEVSCNSAGESSPISISGAGPPGSSTNWSTVKARTPESSSISTKSVNGSPSTAALASINESTAAVSAAYVARFVRAVGWCSMVTDAPA